MTAPFYLNFFEEEIAMRKENTVTMTMKEVMTDLR